MDQLAAVCEDIARHSGRLDKVRILATHLQELDDEDLLLAVRFLTSGPVAPPDLNQTLFGSHEAPKLSIGYSVLREALQIASGWDRETLSVCHTQVGDTGETVGLIMRGLAAETDLALHSANAIYDSLFGAATTAAKRDILVEAFRTYRPLTTKYLVKVITGNLRIGLLEKMVEEAVAQACNVPLQSVRDANNRLGDLGRVAVAARRSGLAHIEAQLFHPMEFMLAKPLDRIEDLADPADWIVEDKYDGIRSQVHFDAGHVRIFSRGMDDVTNAFPEIAAGFKNIPGSGAVDGELLAWRDGRALNFNLLQQRIARKTVRATLQIEVPVTFVAYDLLIHNGEVLFSEPIEHRRDRLHNIAVADPIRFSPAISVSNGEELESLFRAARERGNEGLLLKRKGSLYEAGRRGGSWLKLKRPYGTLDVVVTAAEPGQGRRSIYLSDYTFAVRSPQGFVNIGKAYSGLTDAEVKELTRLLRAASTEKFGRVLLVKPQIVFEVAFDGVQKSARHKSGYALRFPRILRWRRDKLPDHCDDLARVQELYESSLR